MRYLSIFLVFFALNLVAQESLGEVVIVGEDIITNVGGSQSAKKEDIEIQKKKDAKEILDELPTVHFNLGSKEEAAYTIRGFSIRQVPLMINGIPVYVPYSGDIDMSRMGAEWIEQIDVASGISSVLYGPNTLGGVVNIVTKRPRKGFTFKAFSELSTDLTSNSGLSAGFANDTVYIMLSSQYWRRDGFPTSSDEKRDKGLRDNSERDGVYSMLTLGHYLTPKFRQELTYYYYDEEKQLPPQVDNPKPRYWKFPEWSKQNIVYTNELKTDSFKINSKLFYDSYYNLLEAYKEKDFKTMQWDSIYDDYSYGAHINPEFRFLKTQKISFLGFYKKDVHQQGETGREYEIFKMDTLSFAGEYNGEFSNFGITAGLAFDMNMATVNEKLRQITSLNPQIGAVYWITDELNLYLSWSQKTRFPTLKEMFSGYIDTALANPELKEERAQHIWLGVKAEYSLFNAEGAFFYSKVDDKIESVLTETIGENGKALSQNQNIGEFTLTGFELSGKTKYFKDMVALSFGYTFISGVSKSLPDDKMAYQPKNIIKAAIFGKIPFGGVTSLSFRYIDKQYELTSSTKWSTIDSYYLIDLSYEQPVYNGFSVYFKGNNILDENYETQVGFPMAGRELFLGLKYQFK